MKKRSSVKNVNSNEPGKVVLMSVVVAVLTLVLFASIGWMASA